MLGEPLMCVWQAVFAKDADAQSGVKKGIVRSVTQTMSGLPLVHYQEATFNETFKTSKVDLSTYASYVYSLLRAVGAPRSLLLESIEEKCWDICEESRLYSSNYLVQEDVKKLWQIFNRLSVVNSYTSKGPFAAKDEVTWIVEKMAENLGKKGTSTDETLSDEISFNKFLTYLDATLFAAAKVDCIRQCVEDVYTWIVREVLRIGWLTKRTKKHANWTNWLKRWFILTPGCIQYFDNDRCRTHKGSVLITDKTTVQSLSDYSSLTKKMKFRLRVSNCPDLEIELSAGDELDKQQWIQNVETAIESAKNGVTPMAKLLSERGNKQHAQKIDTDLSDKERLAKRASRKITEYENERQDTTKFTEEYQVTSTPESYGSNTLEIQKEKIKIIFHNIDKDGDGKIDKEEFFEFVKGLSLEMEEKESGLVFNIIRNDNNSFISFTEFYDYFIKLVLGDTTSSECEGKLRAAFLTADRNGSGTVNFREFTEFAMNERGDLAMHRLLEAFDKLDSENTGEVSYQQFRRYFLNESKRSSLGQLVAGNPGIPCSEQRPVEKILKEMYDQTDATQLAKYLRKRWDAFASFKRAGASGDVVLKGGHGMVDDVVPGKYALIDLACFNDLPPIEPKHLVVKAQWNQSSVPGKSGRLVFPSDFVEKLPTEIATNETLAYYGCSLADSNQQKVSLVYRHGIQDFTYENNYLEEYVTAEDALGGAGLEKHGFSHLDCPLDANSGFLILGKLEGDDLYLTAFKIPTRHTLYIPPFVIHCNDYLKGTWRTMLSDEVEIDHVQLVKFQRDGKMESYEHFHFSFQSLAT